MLLSFCSQCIKVWQRKPLESWYPVYIILYYIYIYIFFIYKESYWLYILISITLWPFNWYQTLLILWLRTSYMYIWKEIKVSRYTLFRITKLQTFKNNFYYCSKHLPSMTFYYSQKYFTFYYSVLKSNK